MHELERVLAACRTATLSGRRAVLATVVRVDGSAYRRPGARMVLIESGESEGLISGGCLESDLLERLTAILVSGRPQLATYDMRSPDDIVWGLGLGCEGEVRVLLEPLLPQAPPAPYLDFLEQVTRFRRPGVLVTVFAATVNAGVEVGERLAVDASGSLRLGMDREPLVRWFLAPALDTLREGHSTQHVHQQGEVRVEALVEYLAPPLALIVFGAGGDAVPLVRLACEIGWRVGVFDHRRSWARPELFPGAALHTVDYANLPDEFPVEIDQATAAVVMTHHFLHDLQLLAWLPHTRASYIGLLGPHRRANRLFEELARRGRAASAEQRSRIHAPVGLDIGAESAEEIAIAIVAELRAVLAGRAGGYLRDSLGPLHAPAAAPKAKLATLIARGEPP